MKGILHCRRGRRGFTLVEVAVVSFLMVLLALLLANATADLARPMAESFFRCRLNQEAELALASLARDLGGSLSDSSGRLGSQSYGQFVGWSEPAGSQLWLCFDGETPDGDGVANWGAPDTVVSYELSGDSLLRWNQATGDTFVVARYLTGLSAQDLGGGELEITLTFQYRDLSQTYTLIAIQP